MFLRLAKWYVRTNLWLYTIYANLVVGFLKKCVDDFEHFWQKQQLRGVLLAFRGFFVRGERRLLKIQNQIVSMLNNLVLSNCYSFNTFDIILQRLDLIFTDGLLIDNLQKKMYNTWAKSFLIFSVYVFNDRWLFEKISHSVTEQLLWPTKELLYVDGFNVACAVYPVIYAFFFTFVLINLVVLAGVRKIIIWSDVFFLFM